MAESSYFGDLLHEKGAFFRILHETARSQTGFMTVPAGREAGPPEVHERSDQVFYVVEGEAEFRVLDRDDQAPSTHQGGPGTLVVVPAGVQHWVKSVGKGPLLFLTVYAPAEY